jgi:hypothetical protein
VSCIVSSVLFARAASLAPPLLSERKFGDLSRAGEVGRLRQGGQDAVVGEGRLSVRQAPPRKKWTIPKPQSRPILKIRDACAMRKIGAILSPNVRLICVDKGLIRLTRRKRLQFSAVPLKCAGFLVARP